MFNLLDKSVLLAVLTDIYYLLMIPDNVKIVLIFVIFLSVAFKNIIDIRFILN